MAAREAGSAKKVSASKAAKHSGVPSQDAKTAKAPRAVRDASIDAALRQIKRRGDELTSNINALLARLG